MAKVLIKADVDAGAALLSPPRRDDDREGHYVFELGENLSSRYQIISKLGQGTFGQALECWDRVAQEKVAVKVTRSGQDYCADAMSELNVLQVLAKHDKAGTSRHCVQLKDWFEYRGHVCIVCERLGPSLYDFVRENGSRPAGSFPVDLARDIGRQLLECVASMHGLTIAHTDLKPENILLVSPSADVKGDHSKSGSKRQSSKVAVPHSSEIKVIDFGNATFVESEYHSPVVTTREYRAPEVILGLGWSYPCDMWSVGCILAELCTGYTLFEAREDLEHLAMMERRLGPIPQHMMMRIAKRRAKKFFKTSADGRRELNWPDGAACGKISRAVRRLPRLRSLVVQQRVGHSEGALTDLLEGLLKFDPSERLSAEEALNHPFFQEALKMR